MFFRLGKNSMDMEAGGDTQGKEFRKMNLEDEITNEKLVVSAGLR